MRKLSKIIGLIAVTGVMGTAVPAHAAGYQTMYGYRYYDNGQLVGEQRDRCTNSGVVVQGTYVWGYGTTDVETWEWIGCEDGQWVPLQ
jgi:hypothetical protein